MVEQEWERRTRTLEDPVRGLDVEAQLAKDAEAGRPDAVVVVARQAEAVPGREHVRPLQVAQWHPFHERRHAGDLDRRAGAPAGSALGRRVHDRGA